MAASTGADGAVEHGLSERVTLAAERIELFTRSAGWLRCRVAELDEQDAAQAARNAQRTRGGAVIKECFEVLVFAAPAAVTFCAAIAAAYLSARAREEERKAEEDLARAQAELVAMTGK